jgi:UDP-N-acetylmuramoyl-tripeptide--D-alanyl-D-alanine ligase
MRKNASEIARLVHGELVGDDVQIDSISIDSRQIQPGSLYVPLVGARADGHDFMDQVKEKGAAAAFWTAGRPLPEGISLIVVPDPLTALQDLAKAYLKELGCYTVGVTGSNGKTSAKDMMAAVLSTRFKTEKTQGNRNSDIGLPLTILSFPEDTEAAVLEMGMENFGEIELLVSIAPIDAAVITSIGSAHMENLGSRQGIAKAKMEIVHGLKPGGILYYDGSAPELAYLKDAKTNYEKAAFNVPGFQGENVHFEGKQTVFSLRKETYRLNALGQVQVSNAMPAIALAKRLGLDMDKVKSALEQLELTGLRLDLQQVKRARILDDSYKSNPESAKAAIDVLAQLPGQKIAVLADMLDLGPEEENLHAQVGDYAKSAGVDVLLATGPRSQATAKAFGGTWLETKEELYQRLLPYLEEDCTILIKGSRAMAMDKLVQALMKGEYL